jgi:hypothetical protein
MLSVMQEGRFKSGGCFNRVLRKDALHLLSALICRSGCHRRRQDLMGIYSERDLMPFSASLNRTETKNELPS